jgi:1-acyl-sn-glycerol-3-phosphate acyltransferase
LPLLYTIGRLTVGSALAYGWRPHVEGLEHVPRSGGVIFAGNHLSVADELFIAATVPRHLAFWAKSDYFEGTGIRGWFSRNLMNGLGAIPVERKGGRAALEAFDGAVPVLQGGDAVVIYPEGTRSPDGKLYRGRTGAARLAVAAGVPIVPVGTLGTDKVQPIGRMYPKFSRGTITVKFGKPIETVGHPDDRTSLRALTDHLMSEIQKLTGQEYVPTYAPAKPSKDT